MTARATTTPIPSGIEVPDEIGRGWGRCGSSTGFPDDETTRTLSDNLDFQRAVQAYLFGLAPVDMALMRKALPASGPANSTIVIWEDLVHPLFIGPVYNTSTSYNRARVDLHDGPLVVEIQPCVYGGVDDHPELLRDCAGMGSREGNVA